MFTPMSPNASLSGAAPTPQESRTIKKIRFIALFPFHGGSHVQRDLHHGGEGGLPLFRGSFLAGDDGIGDGADGQRPLAVPGGVQIQGGSFHFQRQHAHLLQAVHAVQSGGHALVVTVEHIGGLEVAHRVAGAVGLGGTDCLFQQIPGGDGGEGAGQMELGGEIGVGAGTLTDDQVIQLHFFLDGAGGANPDDVLHAVAVVQLVGVDADGGHAHAGGHDGDLHALVGASIALDTPDVIDEHGIFQKIFRNEFGAQGIKGMERLVEKQAFLNIFQRNRLGRCLWDIR